MKTSNKLFILFFLLSFAILGSIHLALYANYKKGRILSDRELRSEDFDSHPMQTPKWLCLKGLIHATLTPSDHFYVEIAKDNPEIGYRIDGDSLIITGLNTSNRSPHESWSFYWNLPRVNIYFPGDSRLEGFRAEGCYLSVNNPKTDPPLRAAFVLQQAQLWVGGYNPFNDAATNPEIFGEIRITARNSTIIVNRQSVVRSFAAGLDDESEFIDRFSRIDSGTLKTAAHTRINLTGANFNNVTVTRE